MHILGPCLRLLHWSQNTRNTTTSLKICMHIRHPPERPCSLMTVFSTKQLFSSLRCSWPLPNPYCTRFVFAVSSFNRDMLGIFLLKQYGTVSRTTSPTSSFSRPPFLLSLSLSFQPFHMHVPTSTYSHMLLHSLIIMGSFMHGCRVFSCLRWCPL